MGLKWHTLLFSLLFILVAWILLHVKGAEKNRGVLFTLDMRLNLCLIDILWLDPIPQK